MPMPPKPTFLKVIAGNPGKRPLNLREPRPQGNLKEAPPHYEADFLDTWNYAIEHSPAGLLKKIDSSALQMWCSAMVIHKWALGELRKSGLLVKAPNTGLPIQSPYLPIVNRQALLVLRAIDHLGFSPAARVRLVSGEPVANDHGDWGDIAAG